MDRKLYCITGAATTVLKQLACTRHPVIHRSLDWLCVMSYVRHSTDVLIYDLSTDLW